MRLKAAVFVSLATAIVIGLIWARPAKTPTRRSLVASLNAPDGAPQATSIGPQAALPEGPTVTFDDAHGDSGTPMPATADYVRPPDFDQKDGDELEPGTPAFVGQSDRPGLPRGSPDGALQTTYLDPDAIPGSGTNFAGMSINAANGGNVVPPDPNGAVGNGQFVETVNNAYQVFDKTTGASIAGPFLLSSLFTTLPAPCGNHNNGDPIVEYDSIANRWLITQFAIDSPTSSAECVAVSKTPDAAGAYWVYQFSQGAVFADYPHLGVWPDAYYFSYNIFSFAAGNPYIGLRVCANQRSQMLLGLPAAQICFGPTGSVSGIPFANFFSHQPVDFDGTVLPPAGKEGMFLGQDVISATSNILYLFKFHVDFGVPANSTLTNTTITVPTYTGACLGFVRQACIPQPTTANRLESLSFHIMNSVRYRSAVGRERIVATHTVDPGGGVPAAVRWYELRNVTSATPVVFQASTFVPDANSRWMGSIAMDKVGNIALGYSVSNATTLFPTIRYTGRLTNELRNFMEVESNLFTGTGAANNLNFKRWGDYTSMSVDPANDCTFYYTNEYLPASNAGFWATRISYFKFPNCN